MWYSYGHKVKIVTKANKERIGKVIVFESRYDSGYDEALIWVKESEEYIYTIFQSEISSLEVKYWNEIRCPWSDTL